MIENLQRIETTEEGKALIEDTYLLHLRVSNFTLAEVVLISIALTAT
jgi:hypothetical protein